MPWNRTADAMPVSMAETIAHVRITLADSVPDLARGRGPYRCQSQDGSRCHPGAMGWLDYHLWEFEAGDRRYGLPDPDWPDDSLFAAKNTKLKTQAFASSSIPVT